MATDKLRFYVSQRNDVELDREEEDLFADKVWFDNAGTNITADNVQGAIEQASTAIDNGASTGFVFTRNGSSPEGSWGEVNSIPSNMIGLPIDFDGAYLDRFIIINSDTAYNFTLEVFYHDGTNFTSLTTLSVVNSRVASKVGINAPIPFGKELAVQVKPGRGATKSWRAVCIIKGTTS